MGTGLRVTRFLGNALGRARQLQVDPEFREKRFGLHFPKHEDDNEIQTRFDLQTSVIGPSEEALGSESLKGGPGHPCWHHSPRALLPGISVAEPAALLRLCFLHILLSDRWRERECSLGWDSKAGPGATFSPQEGPPHPQPGFLCVSQCDASRAGDFAAPSAAHPVTTETG